MFREIIENIQTDFHAKQESIINSIGGKLKEIIENMPPIEGSSYGNPPYIIDDGENALLLADDQGKYIRLPPFFEITDESVNHDFDAIYSIPAAQLAIIRFIPANPDFEFPSYVPESPEHLNSKYMEMADDAFEKYIENTIALSKQHVAKHLVSMQTQLLIASDEFDMEFDDILQTPDIFRGFYSIFNVSVSSASDRIVELVDEALSEDDEEED